jgi:hypothetical protein
MGQARVALRRAWVWLSALALALQACGGGETTNRPSAVPVPTTVKSKQPPTSDEVKADRAFRAHLQDVQREANRKGWLVSEVVTIPERRAAIVLYDPSERIAKATKTARYEAVSEHGPVLSGESGMIDVVKTKRDALLWDLTGRGSDSVVLHLTPCGPHCGQAKASVLSLRNGRFEVPAHTPECPTCIQDQDRDGTPEFTYRMFALKIAPCARASCGPASALEVEVRGIESYHDGKYARDLRDFVPMYFDRLKEARTVARRVRRATGKSKTCPLNALRTAAEIYVYGRLIGENEPAALKDADSIMRGYDFRPCSKEYDLLDSPKDWEALRGELTAQTLPELQVRRTAAPKR